MLLWARRPTCVYDLTLLASDCSISVGRDGTSEIQLETIHIPRLLSRKHASIVPQPSGQFAIVDQGSTNGTFACHRNQPMCKLSPFFVWQLQNGDTVSFGGLETVIGVGAEPLTNPFLFKFYVDPPGLSTTTTSSSDPVNDADADADGSISSDSKRIERILGSHLTCPVCFEWMLASHTLSCGHLFCGQCLATCLAHKPSCPTCRKPVTAVPVRCFQIDAIIDDLLSPEAKLGRVRRQERWDGVQGMVVQEWATALARMKRVALEAAAHQSRLISGGTDAADDDDDDDDDALL